MTEQWLNTASITADLDTLCDINQSSIPQDDIPLRPVIDRPAAIQVTEDSDYQLLFGDEDLGCEEIDLGQPNLTSIVDMLRTYAPDYSNSLIEATYKTDSKENGDVKSDQILELVKADESTKLNFEDSNLNPDAPEFVSTKISLGSLIKRKLQEDLIEKEIGPEDNKSKNRRNVAICSLLETLSASKKEFESDRKNATASLELEETAKEETLPEIKSSLEKHAKNTIDRGEPSRIPKENTLVSNSPLAAMKHNRVKEWVRDPHSFIKSDLKKGHCKIQLDLPIGFTKKVISSDSLPDNQSVQTASGTSSPSPASIAPVTEYVETEKCDALYLKYQQKAQLRQIQKEDIWTRTKRELKKRDAEILRKRREESAECA